MRTIDATRSPNNHVANSVLATGIQSFNPLTETEKRKFEQCEEIINRGLATVFDVGNALLTIRDHRLFRSTHPTFEGYCHERWGIGRSYAWRVIGAAERLNLLPAGQSFPKPINEFQVRPFLKLNPEAFPTAWEQTVKMAGDGKITPTVIRTVLRDISSQCSDEPLASKKVKTWKPPTRSALGQVLGLLWAAKSRIERGETEQAIASLDRIEKVLYGPSLVDLQKTSGLSKKQD